MASCKVSVYRRQCTKRGAYYFPSGLREGVFIHVVDDDHGYGVGEFSPMTNIHHLGVEDVVESLKSINGEMVDELFSKNASAVSELADGFGHLPYPLSYLLSMAHFHKVQLNAGGERTRFSLKLSALIETPGVNDAVLLAQHYLAQGYQCLKIKVGLLSVADEIKKVKTIASLAGKKVTLRLDANRRFSVADAVGFLTALSRIKIDYIEEPLKDTSRLNELGDECQVDIAIDESFSKPFDINRSFGSRIKFLILKPSRFHSVYEVLSLAAKAQLYGMTPIFSPCFESEFSSAIHALMIEDLQLLHNAHGVITEGFFKTNVTKSLLRPFRGSLLSESVDNVIRHPQTRGEYHSLSH